jgi:hypothetical protein
MYNKCHEFIEVNSSVGQVDTHFENPHQSQVKNHPMPLFKKKIPQNNLRLSILTISLAV